MPKGQQHCTDCLNSLLAHREASVRQALLAEPGLPDHAVVVLSADRDVAVMLAAQKVLSARGLDQDETEVDRGIHPVELDW